MTITYAPRMRSMAVLLVSALSLTVVGAAATAGGASAPRVKAIDECKLLTAKQAATIMGTKPFSPGAPDNDGCSWETDPTDRAHLAYVTITVFGLKKYLHGKPDIRTEIDESTNVGIDPLPGVGDEAFSTYSPLSGPDSADGITVRVGKQVFAMGFQPVTKVANPSPELDAIIAIVKKAVAKVEKS